MECFYTMSEMRDKEIYLMIKVPQRLYKMAKSGFLDMFDIKDVKKSIAEGREVIGEGDFMSHQHDVHKIPYITDDNDGYGPYTAYRCSGCHTTVKSFDRYCHQCGQPFGEMGNGKPFE